MSDVRIVHKREVGYSERGQSVCTSESYVKVLTSFRSGALRMLKGAPLSIFICVALHEADDAPGVSRKTMEKETGYSHPAVIYATEFLTDPLHAFIEETGQEADGTKRYRVAAYAWFGTKTTRGSSIPPEEDNRSASSIRPSKGATSSGQPSKKSLPPKKVLTPPHDDVVLPDSKADIKPEEHHHDVQARRKVFFEAGFRDPRLQKIAEVDAPIERAKVWADWTVRAQAAPGQFPKPWGYAFAVYTRDPFADPPPIQEAGSRLESLNCPMPAANAFGVGPAGELWRSVLIWVEERLPRGIGGDVAAIHLRNSRVIDYDAQADRVYLAIEDPSGFLEEQRQLLETAIAALTQRGCELEIVDVSQIGESNSPVGGAE